MSPVNPEAPAKRKTALFGGTFDPVHYGHLRLAEWVKKHLELDSVFFIPIRIHPFNKRKNITPAIHRLNMLRQAVGKMKDFEVSSIELDRDEVSYTVDTLRTLHQAMPDREFYLLIGDDNLPEFRIWKEPEEIAKLAKIVVFRRSGLQENSKEKYADFIFVDNPLIKISSSEIRERLRHGLPVEEFIPPAVLNYIRQHRLYILK